MIKNFIRDQYNIINKAIASVSTLFNINRYGLKGCENDDCYDYNLIKFELLQWQIIKEEQIIPPTPSIEHIYWGFYSVDPYNDVITGAPLSYQFSKLYILNNSSIFQNLDFTNSSSGQYLILKEPLSALVKTDWFNTSFNYGVIPDQVFRAPVIFGEYRYYVSRIPVFLPVGSTQIDFQ